jgi:hypothetical protein
MKMGKALLLTGILVMVGVLVPVSGTTLYVDGSVSQSGNGQSWETAFKRIQEGMEAASDGDTVIVAEGTYVENIVFDGMNIVLTSTGPSDPAVVANTIIDGNQAGSVVTFSGEEDESCFLSGFTIRNGKADRGGGILGGGLESQTGATIRNNVVTGNSATGENGVGGGFAYCAGTVKNNRIIGNGANFGGGLYGCNAIVRNNLIAGNSAGSGGGLYDCGGTIQSNTIADNSAMVFGGGLRFCRGTIENCVIWGNRAASDAQLSCCWQPAYSCIQGWTGHGQGNTSNDPLFIDADGADDDPGTPGDNDYHLAGGSPCIDSGNNQDWMEDAEDLDGNPRIRYGVSSETVDMGAYEYLPARITSVTATTSGRITITWRSFPGYTYAVWSRADLLTGQWAEQGTVLAQGTTTSWTDTGPPRRMKFYRIETR